MVNSTQQEILHDILSSHCHPKEKCNTFAFYGSLTSTKL